MFQFQSKCTSPRPVKINHTSSVETGIADEPAQHVQCFILGWWDSRCGPLIPTSHMRGAPTQRTNCQMRGVRCPLAESFGPLIRSATSCSAHTGKWQISWVLKRKLLSLVSLQPYSTSTGMCQLLDFHMPWLPSAARCYFYLKRHSILSFILSLLNVFLLSVSLVDAGRRYTTKRLIKNQKGAFWGHGWNSDQRNLKITLWKRQCHFNNTRNCSQCCKQSCSHKKREVRMKFGNIFHLLWCRVQRYYDKKSWI